MFNLIYRCSVIFIVLALVKANPKLFADKTESANNFNNDPSLISNWAFRWKMIFSPDPNKPAQEVLLSRKKKVSINPVMNPDNIQVKKVSYQKHLGIFLDENLLLNRILKVLSAK